MSGKEGLIEQPRRIRKADTLSDLPSLIERGGIRTAYIELPETGLEEELLTASQSALEGRTSIAFEDPEEDWGVVREGLKELLTEKGTSEQVAYAILARFDELAPIFTDYSVIGVVLTGKQSDADVDTKWHADISHWLSEAIDGRRIIAGLAGKATEFADDKKGSNAISLKSPSVSVHRFSNGKVNFLKIAEGKMPREKFKLGGYHRRPMPEEPRLLLTIDIQKSYVGSRKRRQFRP